MTTPAPQDENNAAPSTEFAAGIAAATAVQASEEADEANATAAQAADTSEAAVAIAADASGTAQAAADVAQDAADNAAVTRAELDGVREQLGAIQDTLAQLANTGPGAGAAGGDTAPAPAKKPNASGGVKDGAGTPPRKRKGGWWA